MSVKKHQSSDLFFEKMAIRFRLLGEPMRLRILRELMEGEKNVSQLAEGCGSTIANTSRHLQVLTHHNILSRCKKGVEVYYKISDQTIPALCEFVCDHLLNEEPANTPFEGVANLFRPS
ncbi:MAG: winged helix-turn-helix transcriptional regulator [Opitutales bacterium]|nr:winged helix-turn-helix transcriptional regulator [Opitutales bacterium]MCH8541193.1 metalloregulator ArsR/SmtB family transcription factor [Opitutales bacterium]